MTGKQDAELRGRAGGLANTAAQRRARRLNGQAGGRPVQYQLQHRGRQLEVQAYDAGVYTRAESFSAAALMFLASYLYREGNVDRVRRIADGLVSLGVNRAPVPAGKGTARTSGRPFRYQLTFRGHHLQMRLRDRDGGYAPAEGLDAAALTFLARWLYDRGNVDRVTGFDGDGLISLGR